MKIRTRLYIFNICISLLSFWTVIIVSGGVFMTLKIKDIETTILEVHVKTTAFGKATNSFTTFYPENNQQSVVTFYENSIKPGYHEAESSIRTLENSYGYFFVSPELREKIEGILHIWQINQQAFEKTSELISAIQSSPKEYLLKGKSQLQIIEDLAYSSNPEERNLILLIQNLRNSIHTLSLSAAVHSKLIQSTTIEIKNQINKLVKGITFTILCIAIMSTLITGMLHRLLAGSITRRIGQVEEAISNVSKGDFSSELLISSNDEFGALSEKYSFFKTNLQYNIKLVFEGMKHINDSISNEISFDDFISIILESAQSTVMADSIALFQANGSIIKKISATHQEGSLVELNQQIVLLIQKECVEQKESFFAKEYDFGGKKLSLIIEHISYNGLDTNILLFIKEKEKFSDLDKIQADIFSEFAAISIANYKKIFELRHKQHLEKEMDITRNIQRALLPESLEHDDFEITAAMIPAEEVGGDYYDFIKTDHGEWFVIGDVSGHGVASGLIAMMVETSIHTLIKSIPDISPSELIKNVDTVISKNIGRFKVSKYMTICIIKRVGDRYIYAGQHLPILVYRSKDQVLETILTKGSWIGFADTPFSDNSERSFHLHAGDTMLLFSDGIIEATQDSEMKSHLFGFERLKKLFLKSASLPGKDIINSLIKAVEPWEISDDICLYIIRKKSNVS